MRIRPSIAVACLLGAAVTTAAALAQTGAEDRLDAEARAAAVDRIGELLAEHYVFLDVAAATAEYLEAQLESGRYDDADNAMVFAQRLTEDLHASAADRHLRVRFDPRQTAAPEPTEEEREAQREAFFEQARRTNYQFRKLEILDGNVGYIDFRAFVHPEVPGATDTAAAAMNFLSNSDAVIVDLRQNGGGSPDMVQFICSYFFGAEPVHLNGLYYRGTDETRQFWTLPHVPGKRMPDIPLYVLTSARTFSGAEEFAYNMKTRERATIVGETTGGGANPGGTFRVDDHFSMFISTGRAVNPVTGTNWEGVGVEPDIKSNADDALAVAHRAALLAIAESVASEDHRRRLEWAAELVAAELEPVVIDEPTLRSYAGSYGPRRIRYEGGRLLYSRDGGPERVMIAITPTRFALEGIDYFRLEFDVSAEGRVHAAVGLYDDGSRERSDRDA